MMREEDLLSVKWFRRGVRLHDNPALHATLQGCGRFAGIYIFDTFYNREFKFLVFIHSFLRLILPLL